MESMMPGGLDHAGLSQMQDTPKTTTRNNKPTNLSQAKNPFGRIRKFRLHQWSNRRYTVYMSAQQQGSQSFITKMSNYRRDWRSIFFYDARTQTLRNFRLKHMVLGEQQGYGIRRGGNAAFRRFRRTASAGQKVRKYSNYVSNTKWCLSPHKWTAKEGMILTWWNCQGNINQYWWHNYNTVIRRASQTHQKRFRLHQYANPRYVVYMSNHQQGVKSYIAKLSSNQAGWNTIFFYDSRTRSLRNSHKKTFVIGCQLGWKVKRGGNVAFREYSGRINPGQNVYKSSKYLRMSSWCLTPHGWTARQNGILTWYNCQNRNEQKWDWNYNTRQRFPSPFGKIRSFRLEQYTNRRFVIFMSPQQQGSQSFIAKVTNYRNDWRSIFFFDTRTTTLRNFRQKYMILGEQVGYGMRKGGNAAFRRYRQSVSAGQKVKKYSHFIKNSKWCLTVHGWKAVEGKALTWWNCANGHQYWMQNYATKIKRGDFRNHKRMRLHQYANPRYVLIMSTQQQGTQSFVAKLSYNAAGWNTIFFYDSRTRSLRNSYKKTFVIGGQIGK
jgi:hypothetical protein